MPDETTAVILLAAGSSARMGGEDKLWADLGGEPLIAHSLRTLASLDGVDVLVLVAPPERHAMLRSLAGEVRVELRTAEGGERRQDSVAAGIAAAPDAAWYLVHDGARPLLSAELARRTLDGAREHGAALPALAIADTLKRIDGEGRVLETIDRDAVRAVQTPQAFAGDLLRRAHAASREDATDDATLVERLGEPVYAVEGEARNLKVTTPADLALARALIAAQGGG
ncbi:MAG: 2-C-methyl-D-erythritol 4-phosphate cytidylyltransferase [Dehalococcoidia bacterium]